MDALRYMYAMDLRARLLLAIHERGDFGFKYEINRMIIQGHVAVSRRTDGSFVYGFPDDVSEVIMPSHMPQR